MKKIILTMLVGLALVSGCNKNKSEVSSSSNNGENNKIMLSNIADDSSKNEIETILKNYLDKQSVDEFLNYVNDYNETIENTSLNTGFTETLQPEYDVSKIDELWANKKGLFIGTNCRINTFTLLKRNIEINNIESNTDLLFLDHEAINEGKLFNEDELNKFNILFSRVKTEKTKDVNIHAEKMKEHFKNIKFNNDARMISVVMNDDLDGDYLFVGHVGVMINTGKEVVFIEKLSFQEPYQAIKFETEEKLYDYLLQKYGQEYGQETANAFIMNNDEFVKSAK